MVPSLLSHASRLFLLALVADGRYREPIVAGELEGSGRTERSSAADRAGLRPVLEALRHRAVEVQGGYRAPNPGQGWHTVFDGRGFSVEPVAGGWEWGLELVRYGFSGAMREVREPLAMRALGQRVAYEWDEILEEWYVNDVRGLEHGYVVRRSPPRDERSEPGVLLFELAVRGDLCPRVSADGRDVHFGSESGIDLLSYSGLTVLDADGRELEASFREHPCGLLLSIDDRGARYPLTIDPIAQQAYLKASNAEEADLFGFSVSFSGDTAVVGAPWQQDASGAVYVFVRTGTTWTQEAFLKAGNVGGSDEFGRAVSVSGDTILVGARLEASNATGVNGNGSNNTAPGAGAAYVFVRSGTTWTQQAYLKASNTQSNDFFGISVSLSGDTAVIGATLEDRAATGVGGNAADNSTSAAGAAYVFVRDGTTWSQQAYLKASNTGAGDEFGAAVSVSGDIALVTAALEDSNATGVNGDGANNAATSAGAAYAFVRDGTTWSPDAYLKASNTLAQDQFGFSVSVSGATAAIGAHGEDTTAPSSGAAYVFVRDGTGWSQQALLKASNAGAFDEFGASVAVEGDRIVVGARNEASGLQGHPENNSAPTAGAAYLFVRSGATWSEEVYLKASNTEAGDYFGCSVALSDNLTLVGACLEDSPATAINGGQGNGKPDSGAAYVFETCPRAAVGFRNEGTNPASYTASPVVIGGTFTATVDNTLAGQLTSVLFAFDTPFSFTLAGGQSLLCLDLGGSGEQFTGAGLQPSSSAGGVDSFSLPFADDTSTCGVVYHSQAIQFGNPPFVLSNAQDMTIGCF